MLSPPPPNGNFVSACKIILKNRNWTIPVVCYFTWKLGSVSTPCEWLSLDTVSCFSPSPDSSNFVCLTIFEILWGLWHSFNLKLGQLICKKALKCVLLDNYLPDLFIEVQILYWKPFKFDLGRFSERQSKILTIKVANKDISWRRKFCRKSCSNYFETS